MRLSSAIVMVVFCINLVALPTNLRAQGVGSQQAYRDLLLSLNDDMIDVMKKNGPGIAYVYDQDIAGKVQAVYLTFKPNVDPSAFELEDTAKISDLGKPLVIYLDDQQIQELRNSPSGLISDVKPAAIPEITRVVLRYRPQPVAPAADSGFNDPVLTDPSLGVSGSIPARTPPDSTANSLNNFNANAPNLNMERDSNTIGNNSNLDSNSRNGSTDFWPLNPASNPIGNKSLTLGDQGLALNDRRGVDDRAYQPQTNLNGAMSQQTDPRAGSNGLSSSGSGIIPPNKGAFSQVQQNPGNFDFQPNRNSNSGNIGTNGNPSSRNGTTWATRDPSDRFAANVSPPNAAETRNSTEYGNRDRLFFDKLEELQTEMDALRKRNYQLELTSRLHDQSPTDHMVTPVTNGGITPNVKPSGTAAVSTTEFEELKQKNREMSRTVNFVFFLLFCSIGLCAYLSWIARGFYARYAELADELRETLTGSP